jgi:sulfotransferase family protein
MIAPRTERPLRDGRLKVLYVIGWGRSGSTIIDNLLGGIDGFFSGGEIRNIWHEGLSQIRRCGCGETVPNCPVWSSVLREVFGTNRPEDIYTHQILGWQRAALRSRQTWRILAGTHRNPAELEAYQSLMTRVYHAVADVTHSGVIVDSSKVPSDAAMLLSVPSIEAFFVHLVRDPRATAYSWLRRKARLDGSEPEDMPRFSLIKNAFSWNEFNLGAEAVARRAGEARFMRLRYEDFVASPREMIGHVAEFVGEGSADLPFSDQRTGSIGINHTVSGNPTRFMKGQVTIRVDDEWIRNQAAIHRWSTTIMSWPLLRRYSYPIYPRPDDAPAKQESLAVTEKAEGKEI